MEREKRNSQESIKSQTRSTTEAGPSNRPGVTNSTRSTIDLDLDQDQDQVLDKGLKKPDSLVGKKAKVTIERTTKDGKGKSKTTQESSIIDKDKKFKIIGEQNEMYKIQYYTWNSDKSENERMETIEALIAKNDVQLGSNEQKSLDEINKTRTNQVKILPDQPDGIKQEDVYQAGVSDCYLQAALIAIAKQKPEHIFNMVKVEGNKVMVTFHFGTNDITKPLEQREVTVDKSLLLNDEGQLVYGGKIDDKSYLWPAFIQKAWAASKGGYAESAMGQLGEVIKAITGEGSSLPFKLSSEWKIYKQLKTALEGHKAAALSTGIFAKKGMMKQIANKIKEPSAPSDQPHGDIRVLHAYAVLDMDQKNFTEEDFKNTSMPNITLTLRDPRNIKGEAFKRTLKQVVREGKFDAVHTGYNSYSDILHQHQKPGTSANIEG